MSRRSLSFRQLSANFSYQPRQPLGTARWSLGSPELRYLWSRPHLLVEWGGVQGLAGALRSHPTDGLFEDEVVEGSFRERKERFGSNHYPKPEPTGFLEYCKEALQDPMLVVLCLAGAVSIILGLVDSPKDGWIDGLAILVTVVIVTVVTAGNNVQQDKQFRALEEQQQGNPVSVIRCGFPRRLVEEELLVGDVVELTAGDSIPADGVLLPGDPVAVNEAQMTGESTDVRKIGSPTDTGSRDFDPFLMAGTDLKEGHGLMLVLATGVQTLYGQIMESLASKSESTPLQQKLEKVAALVGYVGGGVAVVLFLALLIGWVIEIEGDEDKSYRSEASQILDFFVMAVTIVVVAVPEGLPLAVTVSLAYSMKQMMRDAVLVRVLAACETMGNATTICSDKTGTLTMNRMTVVRGWFGGSLVSFAPPALDSNESYISPSGSGLSQPWSSPSSALTTEEDQGHLQSDFVDMGRLEAAGRPSGFSVLPGSPGLQRQLSFSRPGDAMMHLAGPQLQEMLVQALALNSQARWCPQERRWTGGNSTEQSLLRWQTLDQQVEVEREREQRPVIRLWPFDSHRKSSSVLVQQPLSPDILLALRDWVTRERERRFQAGFLFSESTEEKDAGIGDGRREPEPLQALDTLHSWEREQLLQALVRRPQLLEVEGSDSSIGLWLERRAFKGAAEAVLAVCNRWVDAEDRVRPLVGPDLEAARSAIDEMTRNGLRTIAFCVRDKVPVDLLASEHRADAEQKEKGGDDRDADHDDAAEDQNRRDCIFLGVVGIQDPLRPEAYASVRQCQQAGVVVRMVTGDHLETARFIARDCGILTDPDSQLAMTGPEFRSLLEHAGEQELRRTLPRLRVLARSQPQDKEKLVKWLKDNGEVVAATGDGTNDSPALKAAHVGLAMGISGTAVCKKAADIVITDDNFRSIVKAVMWGRSVYDNIRKFVQFQLTVNVVALVLTLIGAFSGYPNPLKPVQLLWVNLIMDTMAALALGTEKPDPSLLRRRPYSPGTSLFSPIMWRNVFGQSLLQLVILCLVLFAGDQMFQLERCPDTDGSDPGDEDACETYGLRGLQHYTLVFNTFVFLQVFNEINCRKVNAERNVFENIFANPIFAVVIGVTLFFQLMLVEFLGSFARTRPLTAAHWIGCVGLGALTLPFGYLLRWLLPLDENAGRVRVPRGTFRGAHLRDSRFDDWQFKLAHDREIAELGHSTLAAAEDEDDLEDDGGQQYVGESGDPEGAGLGLGAAADGRSWLGWLPWMGSWRRKRGTLLDERGGPSSDQPWSSGGDRGQDLGDVELASSETLRSAAFVVVDLHEDFPGGEFRML